MSNSPDRNVALQILKHLVDNPEGMDTLEGIARFWVLRQRIEMNMNEVENAVINLAEEGLLIVKDFRAEPGCGAGPFYCLNPSRLSEIRGIVSGDADR
jgi:hypothetical protein